MVSTANPIFFQPGMPVGMDIFMAESVRPLLGMPASPPLSTLADESEVISMGRAGSDSSFEMTPIVETNQQSNIPLNTEAAFRQGVSPSDWLKFVIGQKAGTNKDTFAVARSAARILSELYYQSHDDVARRWLEVMNKEESEILKRLAEFYADPTESKRKKLEKEINKTAPERFQLDFDTLTNETRILNEKAIREYFGKRRIDFVGHQTWQKEAVETLAKEFGLSGWLKVFKLPLIAKPILAYTKRLAQRPYDIDFKARYPVDFITSAIVYPITDTLARGFNIYRFITLAIMSVYYGWENPAVADFVDRQIPAVGEELDRMKTSVGAIDKPLLVNSARIIKNAATGNIDRAKRLFKGLWGERKVHNTRIIFRLGATAPFWTARHNLLFTGAAIAMGSAENFEPSSFSITLAQSWFTSLILTPYEDFVQNSIPVQFRYFFNAMRIAVWSFANSYFLKDPEIVFKTLGIDPIVGASTILMADAGLLLYLQLRGDFNRFSRH